MLQRAISRAVRRAQQQQQLTSNSTTTTRWITATRALHGGRPLAAMPTFSEPSHFPENILVAGGGYHDDLTAGMASPEQLDEIYNQLKHDLEMKLQQDAERRSFDSAAAERFHLDPNLDEMAVNAFSESSTFPEFTPSEDGLLTQTHGRPPSMQQLELQAQIWEAQETPITLAQSVLLDEMPAFSEPSDFPECAAVEEAIASRKRTAGSD